MTKTEAINEALRCMENEIWRKRDIIKSYMELGVMNKSPEYLDQIVELEATIEKLKEIRDE